MNVYCGIIILPLVYLYFKNTSIDKRERKLMLVFIMTMIIPCFIGILNYIWHLFTVPSSYSFRYSFLLCFVLITIAYKSFTKIEITKQKVITFMAFYSLISFFFVIITCFGKYYDFLNYKLIWITVLLLIIYFILLMKKKKKIVLVLLLIESILNIVMIFNRTEFIYLSEYEKGNNIIKPLIEKYKDKNYRIETMIFLTCNDSIIMKYKGISNFLSTMNKRTLNFLHKHEDSSAEKANVYMYLNQNYTLDSLLGLKYIITSETLEQYKLVEQIKTEDKEYNVYENPNYIGLGTIVKNKCNDEENKFNCLFDIKEDLYKEYKNKNGEYEIKKGYYYIYIDDIQDTNFEDLNKQLKDDIYKKSVDYITYKSTTNKKIKLNTDETIDAEKIKVMYFDYDKFKSFKRRWNIDDNYSI